MNNEHLCHCGHEQLFHTSTNNECLIMGCPCLEGFQPKWMEISPRLYAALADADSQTRISLQRLERDSK